MAVGANGTILFSSGGEVAWNGTLFVAVGASGTIVYSRDGNQWIRTNESATSVDLHGVAGNGTHFRDLIGSERTAKKSRNPASGS